MPFLISFLTVQVTHADSSQLHLEVEDKKRKIDISVDIVTMSTFDFSPQP